ncbi:energy-coupling factor transporter transmembrane component T [Buttiauxella selenatireducens]|uniref:Energy-coupling factor transporter transmembrane component T n=1 Tax=Buttiauxella selenatireducens TaxID=3073902 RepID=A0ABY9S9F5_9ENTR|nr:MULTISPECIES: energy-coupling factor transporter transmembrane component T [unclassified Buttiauxella]WMY74004.1 energy-coupling factor transporter transmembrane component T [Buttiauxella sp. R73]GDX07364.1 energy-coupling factor transporter transmembrane protein EcfT [Buttiauxella sp. A111]
MHPFTSLTIWVVLGISSLLMPLGYPLLVYSLAIFLALILMKSTRHRWRYVVWIMLPMAGGLWLVHSGWLAWWLHGEVRDNSQLLRAAALWLRLLALLSSGQILLQFMPTQRFIRALFASRLPLWLSYLLAGPLLIVEQLRAQLAAIYEAQLARGVPLDGRWYQRLRYIPALVMPLTHSALNDLTARSSALDMRAFRLHPRRTTLWAPPDSTFQRGVRYVLLLVMILETGVWLWLWH